MSSFLFSCFSGGCGLSGFLRGSCDNGSFTLLAAVDRVLVCVRGCKLVPVAVERMHFYDQERLSSSWRFDMLNLDLGVWLPSTRDHFLCARVARRSETHES